MNKSIKIKYCDLVQSLNFVLNKLFLFIILFSSISVSCILDSAYASQVLKRGNGTEPDTLDPHKASGTWENNIIGDMFLGLTTESASGDIIPGSAISWSISNDGKVYTFKIRKNLYWSDSAPLTASDFVFGFRRILDPDTASQYASLLYPIKNAYEINTGQLPVSKLGVLALNEDTLQIILKNPATFFIHLLSHYTTFPVPEHILKKNGDDWIKPEHIVSNGPYVLTEWVSNTHVLLKKNPYFYDENNIFFDEVFFYPIEDSRTALRMFRSGDIDMNITTGGFPSAQVDQILEEFPDEARVFPYLANSYLPFNLRKPPFDDVRIRKAISLLIDREIINEKVIKLNNPPAYAFVPPQVSNNLSVAKLDFFNLNKLERVDLANKLIAESGYNKNKPLSFELMFRNSYDNARRMSAIAAMLKIHGVLVKIIPYEARIAYSRMGSSKFDLGDAGWVADYNDPLNFLYLLKCDSGPMNYSGYCNKEYDGLIDLASRTANIQERSRLMSKAEQLMLDDHPIIPMEFSTHRVLVSKSIQGFKDNISNIHRTRFMYKKN